MGWMVWMAGAGYKACETAQVTVCLYVHMHARHVQDTTEMYLWFFCWDALDFEVSIKTVVGNHHQNATFSSGCVCGLHLMRTWRRGSGALGRWCVRQAEVGLGMKRTRLERLVKLGRRGASG